MTKLKNDRHTQAKKAERQSIRNRKQNIKLKNKLKKAIKKLDSAVAGGNIEEAKKILSNAIEVLQTNSRKKILHKNTASRKISQLSKKVNKMKK